LCFCPHKARFDEKISLAWDVEIILRPKDWPMGPENSNPLESINIKHRFDSGGPLLTIPKNLVINLWHEKAYTPAINTLQAART